MFRFLIVSLFILSGCASSSKKEVNSEGQKLTQIIREYTEAVKKLDSFYASYFNIEEDLEKFGDYLSPEMRERNKKTVEQAIARLKTVDVAQLSPADQIAYRLFKDSTDFEIKTFDFKSEYFSFNQMRSRLRDMIDDSNPDLTGFPLDSVVHYKAFVKRSEGFLPYVDRQISVLKEGAKKGYALNCTIAKNAMATYQEGLIPDIEKSPFYKPVLRMPTSFEKSEQEEIKSQFRAMIKDRMIPGFKKFDDFYKNEYLPQCRSTYGISKVPRGAELYLRSIRRSTDLDLDPKTIHKIGLQEVKRIQKELTDAFKKIGYKGDLRSNLIAITNDPQSYYTDVKTMFADYDRFRADVSALIPNYFSLQPKTDFKIVEGGNPEDAAGSYSSPTDFVPYGRFIVNAKNLKATPKWGIRTLFLHEAIPGHHFHLALQYEMKEQLSEYQRKIFDSNAFAEGWALYAERWGREAGLVSDPHQMIGSLSDEMLRAVRLVVDTGIHAYGWPREKVLRYMQSNLASDARDIQIEADRYSVWPGQALGYKIGQLKILELRELAKKKLGAQFDIKEFHRVVIGQGTVSLPVLESKVLSWIESTEIK